MDAQREYSAEEVTRLRDDLNDLVSIMALPAQWAGGEPGQIVSTLLDVLLGTLQLGFVCVRLNDPAGGRSTEMMRAADSRQGTDGAQELASAHLGLRGEIGIIAAGAPRSDFPTQTEKLLLDVAANQAALALQQAHLVREREQSTRELVDSIPGFIAAFTPSGEVEFVNRPVLEYFGKTLEELKHWGSGGTTHPEDLPRIVELFSRAIASGEPFEWEVRARRFDGSYRWFQSRGFPLRDTNGHIIRWYNLLIDIDERKRTEAELRRAYDHLTEAQRLSQTGSFTADLERGEHYWSDEFYRICGFEPGSPVTIQRLGEIVHPEDAPLYEGAIGRAMEGTEPDFYFRIVTSNGVVKHLRGFAHRIADRPVFVGAVQDVTSSKMAQEALNRAGAELAHVSRLTSLSALTASIAHEVNQPLSGIITNASTCLRMLDAMPPNVEGARETARRTIRDGNRAADVISRLRALFSKREFAVEPLDLNEAAREVIALSSNDLQRNRIILQPELADNLPAISGDRIQLQQVILNLLRNASDAMVDVHDRPRQLLIRTETEDGDHVRLTVRDAGVGLSTQSMASLFDAFYTTKSGGMGIGLFVSRSIVERHQGRLWAQPNDGGPGATFAFSIPCAGADTSNAAAALRIS